MWSIASWSLSDLFFICAVAKAPSNSASLLSCHVVYNSLFSFSDTCSVHAVTKAPSYLNYLHKLGSLRNIYPLCSLCVCNANALNYPTLFGHVAISLACGDFIGTLVKVL